MRCKYERLLVGRAIQCTYWQVRKEFSQFTNRCVGLLLVRNQPPVKLLMYEVREQQIVTAVVAESNRQYRMAMRRHRFVNQDWTGKYPRRQIETLEQAL